ncbi:hypothetical protein LTR78_002815 [Recurvomyces mirabilis]|uniref:Uncharacterized protein n=1 Tax=Recurvomyces mirabilis TaxID=574656 RepID=A0AAE0WT08_9PEZI|nr:hypothetical protein LTR78_002815 [Recurvomyces mirabilis]KAK5159452.1 hypothetical protein LTS14_002594 [Recurvomyces mirabilis]
MAAFSRHNNHADWSEQQLYDNAPRRLAGTDLIHSAKHYTNDELLKQAQKFSTKVMERGAFTHFLRGACLDYALDHGQEPDGFREAFDVERLRNLEARGDVPNQTLAILLNLSANPDLLELESVRAAYAQK